jgi:hypothetical protein
LREWDEHVIDDIGILLTKHEEIIILSDMSNNDIKRVLSENIERRLSKTSSSMNLCIACNLLKMGFMQWPVLCLTRLIAVPGTGFLVVDVEFAYLTP